MIDPHEQALDAAVAAYLERREDDPGLLPGVFAQTLPTVVAALFLREVEALAEVDRLTLAPPRDLPVRLGDFRILAELGRGATGRVFRAEQVSLRRCVALKVLHPHVASDPRLLARFRREAQIAAALEHPGIVPIYGIGEECGSTFLVMGAIDGHALQRLLVARGDPRDVDHARAQQILGDLPRLAAAFADVADALHFAHARQVVHRDIKPANLLVRTDGGISVLDFGIASSRGDEVRSLTATGDFLGTPIYMSPEQAAGETAVGPASDVYSLGAVLYECATGKTCVPDGTLPQIFERIRRDDVTLPWALAPELPRGLGQVILKCLEKRPEQRYASAAELAADLRRFAQQQQVAAPAVSSLTKFTKRVRTLGLPLLLVVVLVAGVLAVACGSAREPRSQDDLAQRIARLRIELEALNDTAKAMNMQPDELLALLERLGADKPAKLPE